MTSAESKVLYKKRGEIAYITLNRPQKLNAIDDDVEEQLFQAWTRFREDPDVRLAILSGNGDKAFCAVDVGMQIGAGAERLLTVS